jgi:NAD(P)-dependent dehydrogenase (short-subunit alcohol dehydrogenase family)
MFDKQKSCHYRGTTGIGLSAAKAFIDRGTCVIVVGRNEESAIDAKRDIGKNVEILGGDAVDPLVSIQAIEQCISQFGCFDKLYHVAGGSGRKMGDGPLHLLTLEGWNKTLELNLTSLMLPNQAAINQFLKQGRAGTNLNMGSVLGYSPSAQYFSTHAYVATISAIIGFTKSVAAYYARNNIRVNVIATALVETPMAQRAAEDETILSFIKNKQPLGGGRIGHPPDLDGLAIYFMSDDLRFTTRQIIAVDGGWSLSEGQL